MKPRILIAGYGAAAMMGITRLLAEGWQPQDISLLSYYREDNMFLWKFAEGRGIEVYAHKIKSIDNLNWLKSFEYLLSLHYRNIIPESVLNLFPGRAMNLHGGRLPEFRGCWSPSWSIINGKKESGFTYHYIVPGVDEGKIIRHWTTLIEPTDTAFSLYHRILVESMDEFMNAFDLLQKGFEGIDQMGLGMRPHYYNRDIPFGGYIQPGWSDVQVDRYIRAMYFPPHKGALLKLPDGTEREVLTMQQYREAKCLSV